MNRTLVMRLPDQETGDAAAFEPVLDALDQVTPYVEILRPGCAAVPVRRLAGDEAAFCEQLIDTVSGLTGLDCLTGVADGLFAALLASRSGRIVPPGGDAAFLAPFAIDRLALTGLVDTGTCATLRHLGIGTLGLFAALPGAAVAERFGAAARQAQALAAGQVARPLVPRQADPDLTVRVDAEEPYGTVEQALFAARPLAERLLATLSRRNLACTRVTVTAHTVHGPLRRRTWQIEPDAPPAELFRRVRWQLEGWLSSRGGPSEAVPDDSGPGAAPRGGAITALELAPGGLLGLVEAGRGLWDVKDATTARAEAALRHTQGLLGPEAVRLAVERDGRGLAERCDLVPLDAGTAVEPRSGPWPGALPDPPPSRTGTGERVDVIDADGAPVSVAARGALSATPVAVSLNGERIAVTGWAGPWPVVERWWNDASRRYARLQVELADGRAALLRLENRQWTIGGWYD